MTTVIQVSLFTGLLTSWFSSGLQFYEFPQPQRRSAGLKAWSSAWLNLRSQLPDSHTWAPTIASP